MRAVLSGRYFPMAVIPIPKAFRSMTAPAHSSEHDLLADAERRLTRVPLERRGVVAAGRTWQVDAVADQDALLAASDHFEAFPYGLLLWDAAVVFADVLADLGPLTGKRVLELGAGVGFAGLAAAHLGADVLQTDHAAEALVLCARNARLNGIPVPRQTLADWADWQPPHRFDLVIGSDVLYDGSAHRAIARLLEESVADGGFALLTAPKRTATPFFIRDMQADGWRITTEVRSVPALQPSRPDEVVSVSVLRVAR